tara:strand:- start:795 stop:1574 length:780 start_codon:yes stop_codon:yes gene_type:complete
MKTKLLIYLFCLISFSCFSEKEDWVSLFDGESLNGWEMKIAGYELNNNYRNTFSVQDGVIRVSYRDYDLFDRNFGHLFYTKKKYKNYHLKMDYRFYGNHVNLFKNEDEAWNYKNSGVMLHSEDPSKMLLNQEFPVSIEAQFLGGSGIKERPTLNMCSPGTEVDINKSQATEHCISSNSNTYHNEDWISVEFVVYSDSIVHHIINKDTVMSYSNIKIGGEYLSDNFIDRIGEPLKEGFISLQSEGHPIEFKNIRIKETLD